MTTLHDQLRERAGLDKLAHAAEADELERRSAALEEHEDAPEGEDDRYAIYAVAGERMEGVRRIDGKRRRMAETSLEGIGLALRTLREEGEYDGDSRIGILDRLERTWLVNPWARG